MSLKQGRSTVRGRGKRARITSSRDPSPSSTQPSTTSMSTTTTSTSSTTSTSTMPSSLLDASVQQAIAEQVASAVKDAFRGVRSPGVASQGLPLSDSLSPSPELSFLDVIQPTVATSECLVSPVTLTPQSTSITTTTNPLVSLPILQTQGTDQMFSHIPLDIKVPDSVKRKIWSNQFVPFSALLKNDAEQFTLAFTSSDSGPALCLQPKKHAKIYDFDSWSSAFKVFSFVYLQKFPSESLPLIKYEETIRSISRLGGDFSSYDENFRYLRQQQLVPWDHHSSELYVHSMFHRSRFENSFSPRPESVSSNPRYSHPGTAYTLPNGYPLPKGSCFTYHKGEECCECSFSHECPACSMIHPAIHCSIINLQNQPSTTPNPATSQTRIDTASTSTTTAHTASGPKI